MLCSNVPSGECADYAAPKHLIHEQVFFVAHKQNRQTLHAFEGRFVQAVVKTSLKTYLSLFCRKNARQSSSASGPSRNSIFIIICRAIIGKSLSLVNGVFPAYRNTARQLAGFSKSRINTDRGCVLRKTSIGSSAEPIRDGCYTDRE